jgi:hypothetical protein
MADVGLDAAFGKVQVRGDCSVGQSSRDEHEDREFAPGDGLRNPGLVFRGRRQLLRVLVEEQPRHGGSQQCVTGGDHTHRVDQFVRSRILDQKATGAGA